MYVMPFLCTFAPRALSPIFISAHRAFLSACLLQDRWPHDSVYFLQEQMPINNLIFVVLHQIQWVHFDRTFDSP